jgi:hypothetical protein
MLDDYEEHRRRGEGSSKFQVPSSKLKKNDAARAAPFLP